MITDSNAEPTMKTGVAEVYELHQLKAFDTERRVRKKLFKSEQLWSELVCYEPGQSTVMHRHPYEEEAISVLEGTANMEVEGDEIAVPEGGIVKFPANVMHDVRNLQDSRCVIMFIKIPTRLAKMLKDENSEV